MRLRKKNLLNKLVSNNLILLYGRITPKSTLLTDLLHKATFYKIYSSPKLVSNELEGWIYLDLTKPLNYQIEQWILKDIIQITKNKNNNFNIRIVRNSINNKTHLQRKIYYYNIKLEKVYTKIKNHNIGFIYYNDKLDVNRVRLNYFKRHENKI